MTAPPDPTTRASSNIPPDPTASDSEDKCPICGKPLSTHTYEEQVACTAKKRALEAEHYKKLNDDIDKAETKEAD